MNNKKMEIQKYNEDLILSNTDINILEYVKKLNDKFYNIDISFIDDFIELVDKDDFCIPHELIYKYGVLSERDAHDVKRLLEQYNFLENEHYIVYREDAVNLKGDQKGGIPQNKYLLHPNVFKKCLIRSLKIDKYADYYLLLEKVLKYYNEYQKLKMQNKIEKLEGTLFD